MKKANKGFTLVELLVVIGILGILMGTLYPAISSALADTSMKTFAMNGRKIVQGIIQVNTDRQAKGKTSVWPHNKTEDGLSDDNQDIAGKPFSSATDYFKELFDIEHQTSSDQWQPYIEGYEASWLAGAGVPPAQPGNLQKENVAWTVAKGFTDDLGDFLPVLVSRNANTDTFAKSSTYNSNDMTERITLGETYAQPFGKKGCVIVTKGGGADTYKARDSRPKDIYKSNSFTIPTGVEVSYIEP